VPKDDLVLRTEPEDLRPLINAIVDLANSERNSLGFMPGGAYQAAIDRRRLLALVRIEDGRDDLVGFVLFSGVKTSAKIQQIATRPSFRRRGIAKALIRALVDVLEKQHYLSVQADVASDLD
jgi:ribosomal protein S18 acetylase RimI-like enzyme